MLRRRPIIDHDAEIGPAIDGKGGVFGQRSWNADLATDCFKPLGFGFVVLQREETNAYKPGTLCASPIARRRMKWALWTATIVSIPLVTFPWWSTFVLG